MIINNFYSLVLQTETFALTIPQLCYFPSATFTFLAVSFFFSYNTDRKRTSPFAFTGNRFDGNGYSEEWVEEAAKRGLDCEKSCPKIFERYLDPASIKMFEDMGVMKKNELELAVADELWTLPKYRELLFIR